MIADATPGIPADRIQADEDRLERAKEAMENGRARLDELGEGVYRVRSFSSEDTYQVATRPVTDCHCWDALGGETCKHILLALIYEGRLEP